MGGGAHPTYTVLGQQVPRYSSIRVQTSAQGVTIPVIFGTTRVTGNIIWMDDFAAIYHEHWTREAGGGKGGGGGSASYSKEISYTYQLAFTMGLCEGPISQMTRLWASNSKFNGLPADTSLFLGSYPQTPWSYLTSNHPNAALPYPGIAYVASPNYNLGDSPTMPAFSFEVTGLSPYTSIPILTTYNLLMNGDFSEGNPPDDWSKFNYPGTYETQTVSDPEGGSSKAVFVNDVTGWGGFYQPISETINGHTYKISFWYRFTGGTSLGVYLDNSAYQYDLNILIPHVDEDWHYYEETYTANYSGTDGYTLKFVNGSGPGIGAASFYIWDARIEGSDTVYDSDPGDIITAIVSDSKFGLGLSASLVDVSDYSNWCIAMGFLLSPAFISQALASEHIRSLLDETFSTAIWHNGSVLKPIPYGDSEVIGNGVTWTPSVVPFYDLGDDDFLVDGKEDPVQLTRKSPADCYNDVKIECWNRNNEYNIEIVEAWDQSSIDAYYIRSEDSRTMHDICDPAQADTLARLIVQRSVGIRNVYRFKLGWKYCLLEPMDVVTLTDDVLGMDKAPVRITEIEEDEESALMVTAEEFPEGIGSAALYERQAPQPYAPNFNQNAGPVSSPMIFVPPEELWADSSRPEIWIGAAGSTIWGGCDVYISTDGSTYQYAGTILGRPRIGTLTAALPVGSDPDVANTCSVDISPSRGELLSGTQIDADNLVTLCAVLDGGFELVSYETATLTGSCRYDLTYLRRGAKGTPIALHPAGSKFLRLDEVVFRLAVDELWIHQVVYFKFCSFNIWKSGAQNLSDVAAYQFVIQKPLSDLLSGADSITVLVPPKSVSDSGSGSDLISVSK